MRKAAMALHPSLKLQRGKVQLASSILHLSIKKLLVDHDERLFLIGFSQRRTNLEKFNQLVLIRPDCCKRLRTKHLESFAVHYLCMMCALGSSPPRGACSLNCCESIVWGFRCNRLLEPRFEAMTWRTSRACPFIHGNLLYTVSTSGSSTESFQRTRLHEQYFWGPLKTRGRRFEFHSLSFSVSFCESRRLTTSGYQPSASLWILVLS